MQTNFVEVILAEIGQSIIFDSPDQCVKVAKRIDGFAFWVGREIPLHLSDEKEHEAVHTQVTDSFIYNAYLRFITYSPLI